MTYRMRFTQRYYVNNILLCIILDYYVQLLAKCVYCITYKRYNIASSLTKIFEKNNNNNVFFFYNIRIL